MSVLSQRKTGRERRERERCECVWPAPTCGPLVHPGPSKRKTERARREKERGMWPGPLCVPSERKTIRARRDIWGGCPTPACGPLLLFCPSDRKTDSARRAKGRWVANSYRWPPFVSLLEKTDRDRRDIVGGWPTPTYGPLLLVFLLKERETLLGERRGGGGNSYMWPPVCPI